MMEKLSNLLNSEQSKPFYRYLLIDMLGSVNELSILYLATLTEQLPAGSVEPIPRPEISYDKQLCPQLVCLASPGQTVDEQYVQASFREALQERLFFKRYMGGWLVSELAPEQLAEQLLHAGLRLGAQVGEQFTPFYEPFRLQLLTDGHREADYLNHHLKAVKHYYYLNLDGQVRDALMDDSSNHTAHHALFTPEQLAFFQQQAKNLFYLYAEFVEMEKDRDASLPHNGLIPIAHYYWQAATQLNIRELADRYRFVYYSMRHGDLTQHPTILAAIKRNENEPGVFRQALAQFNVDNHASNETP